MKLHKYIITGMLLMVVAIMYVHLRVEIVKAAYQVEDNNQELSRLVDQNAKLMYNLSKLESPRYLLAALNTEEIEFAGQRSKRNIYYHNARVDSEKQANSSNLIVRIFDVFTPSAEARAHD